tara:strand:+ start:1150 stop:1920 length:771 start_codon:yes stop_codon:yes gene_type:complete
MKQPEAGEWWQRTVPVRGIDHARIYMIGPSFDGRMIGMRHWLPGEVKDGTDFMYGVITGIESIEHLPDCTGWDWKPETFPQYWTTIDSPVTSTAYVVRTGLNDWYFVLTNGEADPTDSRWNSEGRTQLTKEQAEALLDKPTTPDDWVTQDRVPYRREFDECRWTGDDDWLTNQDTPLHYRHGYEGCGTLRRSLQVRCRRKHLPNIEPTPTTRTVTLHQWIVWDFEGNEWEQWKANSPRGWGRVHATGETKTIEVQL